MKKFFTFSFIICVLLVASCGEGKKMKPEEEVRNYGKYFVEKLNDNQLDSLQATYPDILKADSILPVNSDTILIVETSPGQYDLTLTEGMVLKVNRADDGNISVTESKGLFAFPADKVENAKKTGMWDESLSDTQLNERMKDEEFFNYIQDQIKNKTSNILTVGKYVDTSDPDANGRFGYNTLKNNSDVDIDPSDYSMIYYEFDFDNQKYKTRPGKLIPAHGSIKIESSGSTMYGEYFEKIKWNLSEEQKVEKFAPFTGNEYQEYLDSKK